MDEHGQIYFDAGRRPLDANGIPEADRRRYEDAIFDRLGLAGAERRLARELSEADRAEERRYRKREAALIARIEDRQRAFEPGFRSILERAARS